MTHTTFPCEAWDTATPEEAGFASDRLAAVKTWLDQRVEDRRYRFALVRGGKLVAYWCNNAEPGDRLEIASTWKSMLNSAHRAMSNVPMIGHGYCSADTFSNMTGASHLDNRDARVADPCNKRRRDA